jgi:TonB family protein
MKPSDLRNAPTPPERSSRLRTAGLVLCGLGFITVLGVGVFMAIGGAPGAPRKPPEIVQVRIVPPPPPPTPPPPPPPPENKPEPQMMEQPPEKSPEPMKEAKNDEPPPGPLGLDAKGDGPPDGFGLTGNPGGRGFLGGGGGGSRWGWYATIIQTQIAAALREHPKTRNAEMRIQVRLWADSSGRVTRAQLVNSTGDAALDAALRSEILVGLMLREPPPNDMPMPIMTRITERKSS